MHTLDMEKLVKVIGLIAETQRSVRPQRDLGARLAPEDPMVLMLKGFAGDLRTIGMPVTADAVEDINLAIVQSRTVVELDRHMSFFARALVSEFRNKSVLIVADDRARYNRPSRQVFGDKTVDAFPSAQDDMDEALKCLSFKRSTAAVFHLMRVVEAGIKALLRKLKITITKRNSNWGAYIKEICECRDSKKRGCGISWKRDGKYMNRVIENLESVKLAWRNPTMHIDRSYDDEQADEVFLAVKTLMATLSQRFNENKTLN